MLERIRTMLTAAGDAPTEMHFTAPVEITAAQGKQKVPRFELTAYTGGPMRVPQFSLPVIIDLKGAAAARRGVKVLRDHDTAKIVGHADSVEIDGKGIRAAGPVSGSGTHASEIVESSRNGFPWEASIGARKLRMELIERGRSATVNGRSVEGPAYIARRSEIHEISFVALGADDETEARVAASQNNGESDMTLGNGNAQTPPVSDEVRAERERVQAIERITAGDWGNREPNVRQLRAQAIAGDLSIDQLSARCIDELRASRSTGPSISGQIPSDGPDHAQVLSAAFCVHAMGVSEKTVGDSYGEKVTAEALSSRFAGLGLHGVARQVIAAAGHHAPDGGASLIRAAYEASRELTASGFSTMSLPGILSDAAHKTAIDAYRAVPVVWPMICATKPLANFKAHYNYRMTGLGKFEELAADGELKHITLDETKFENKAETKGAMIALTRKDIINDDLGMFAQMSQILGRMGAVAIERGVFALLLSNPSNFFHADNKNLLTGADSTLDMDGLGSAERAFWAFVDANGDPVMINPSVLLVPPTLSTTARTLINSAELITGSDETRPSANPFHNSFRLATSPWLESEKLTNSSAAAWYLFSRPGAGVAALEVGFVNGQQTPIIETDDTDFNTLGMQWRGYFDFGVAMREPQGAVKSAGE